MSKSLTPQVSISAHVYKPQESEISGFNKCQSLQLDKIIKQKYKGNYSIFHIFLSLKETGIPYYMPIITISLLNLPRKISHLMSLSYDYATDFSLDFKKFQKKIKAKPLNFIFIHTTDHVFLCLIDNIKETIETIDFTEYLQQESIQIPVLYRKSLTLFFHIIFQKYYKYYHHDISFLIDTVESYSKKIGVLSTGFCYVFSLYFTGKKLSNSKSSMKTIVKETIKRAFNEPEKFTKYIAGYAQYLHIKFPK